MRHLKVIHILVLLTSLCMSLFGTSCSSDEPGKGNNNEQTNRQPARADIQNANALIVYNGNIIDNSRAIDGEFKRPGLYKIGPDGKVSMVAIYCYTDEDGNKIETEHPVSILPGVINAFSNNYIFMGRCQYCDEDGDLATGAEYILIHTKTGDIYDLSDVMKFFAHIIPLDNTMPRFYESPDGSLLIYSLGEHATVGRITIDSGKANFTQLNNGQGFYGLEGGIYVSSSNQIFSASSPGLASDMGVLFTNGGYDYLASHTLPELSDIETTYQLMQPSSDSNGKNFIWLNDSPAALVRESYYTKDAANKSYIENFISIIRINMGNQLGQISFSEGSALHLISDWSETIPTAACAIGDNLLVEIGSQNPSYFVYNSSTDKWVDMGKPIEFLRNNIGLNPQAVFNGRCWIVDIPDGASGGKVWWIDPAKQQTGSLNIDLAGVDVESIEEDYQRGQLIIRGVRRSDSSNCVLTFDLTSGKSELIFSAPNLVSFNLVLLS